MTLAAPEATGHYAFSVGNKTSTFDVEAAINADNEVCADPWRVTIGGRPAPLRGALQRLRPITAYAVGNTLLL